MKRFLLICLVVSLILSFPTIVSADGELKKGSKGDEVKAVQERLIELGYLSGESDGGYGKQTEAAVKDFQMIAGLPQSGVVDEKTKDILLGNTAPQKPLLLPQDAYLGMPFSKIKDLYEPLFVKSEEEYNDIIERPNVDQGEIHGTFYWNGTEKDRTPFMDVEAFGVEGIPTFYFSDNTLNCLSSVQYNYTILDYDMLAMGRAPGSDASKTELMLKDYSKINNVLIKQYGKPFQFYDWESDEARELYGNDYADAIADEEYSMSDVWKVGNTGIWHVLYYTADDEVIHHIYVEPIDEYNDPESD